MPRQIALKLFAGMLLVETALSVFRPNMAKADELYARIRGTVLDATGAGIAGATVKATNTATNISKSATSTADGSYELLELPIGSYKVTVEKAGFKKYTATGVTLVLNQVYILNAGLEIGSFHQEVVVEAAAAQVEATSMQLGTLITAQQIVDAPLTDRNWVNLQQMAPGVMAGSDRFGPSGGGVNFSTNGSETQQNSYLINGMDSADIGLNTPHIIPSPDAIAEFQMVTSTINPEFGRNSGAILSAVIKSGTNNFHGDAFNFYRDTSLNGRSFFQQRPSVFHQNQFGGTVGGPVWKERTFFFFSYQGRRFTQPQPTASLPFVPTQAEQNGDFSASTANLGSSANSSPIPLFGDSASSCPVSSGSPCSTGTSYSKLFSTGKIPSTDFNSVSVRLIKSFVPVPNLGTNEFTFNPTEAGKADQELFRVDHTFSRHDSIWEYSFFESDPRNDTLPFGSSGQLPGFSETQQLHTQEHTFAWQHSLSENTLNELRAGYQRFNFVGVEPQKVVLPSSVGFTGIIPQDPAGAGVPAITVVGADVNFTLGFSQVGPQPRIDQTYQLEDNFSHVYKNHTIKFGYEGRRFEANSSLLFSNNGAFVFNGKGAFSTGNPAADFLLGYPDTYTQGSGAVFLVRSYEHYSYIQDQWKLKPNFTLTIGSGWDIETPMSDLSNGGVAINCFKAAQQSHIFPKAPVGLLFPGDAGCTSSGYRTHFNDFGPRVGFAWSPDLGRFSGGPGKLSVRAGFGIYYNRSEAELPLQFTADPPFSLTDFGIADVGGKPSLSSPFTDVQCINQVQASIECSPLNRNPASISNKYPFAPPKPGAPVGFTGFEPFGLATIDPNFRSPYAENYNLTIQRELPGQAILTVAYVGSLGHRLEMWYERNPGQPGVCASNKDCAVINPFNEFAPPFNLPPFHQFDSSIFGSIGTMASMGNSNYNSLQISADKHVSNGLQFLASYTYSHSLDWSSSFEDQAFGPLGTDPFNFRRYYGNSSFDARQRLVFNYGYSMPKIPGTKQGLLDLSVNGWRIAGITTFQTGFPVHIADEAFGVLGTSSLTCPGLPMTVVGVACWDSPNVNGPLSTQDPRKTSNHLWFNPTLFSHAASALAGGSGRFNPQTGGNAGRNFIHGPGLNNWDFQLTKEFTLSATMRIELRAEVFNIFNHTQFANPDGNLADGSSFGAVSAIQGLPRILQLAGKFYF